jgi:hypothetical protein
MKSVVAVGIMLVILFHQNVFCSDECKESKILGTKDAEQHHDANSWLIGGLAIGTITGIIGGPVLIMISKDSGPTPTNIPPDANHDCYSFGYCKKASSMNFRKSIIGTSIGTGICVLVVSLLIVGAK